MSFPMFGVTSKYFLSLKLVTEETYICRGPGVFFGKILQDKESCVVSQQFIFELFYF